VTPFDASGATPPPDSPTANPTPSLAHRLQMLSSNGHDWMDPVTQSSFATAQVSDQQMLATAAQAKTQMQNSWDGFAHFFDDPVLAKQPTTALAVRRYFDNTIGTWPVEQTSVQQTQAGLQAAGYGTDLSPSGTWDAEWNAALTQHAQDVAQQQLEGAKPGSVTSGDALSHLLHSIAPTGFLHGLVAFVKSIPGDVRDLVADVAALGGAAVGGHGYQVGAWVENLGRKNGDQVTSDEYKHMIGFARIVNDIGTVLMFTGIGGAGTAVARAAGEGVLGAGLRGALEGYGKAAKALVNPATYEKTAASLEAAQRGPGVVARLLFGGLGKGQLANAAVDGVDREVARLAAGNKFNAIVPKAYAHIPVLGQSAPLLGKLADADGFYYKLRTSVATPFYGRPIGQLAGAAYNQAMIQGGKAELLSGLQNLGSQPDNAQGISANMAPAERDRRDERRGAARHARLGQPRRRPCM
jgi:hypothetical protein